jgi:hypothetical protein
LDEWSRTDPRFDQFRSEHDENGVRSIYVKEQSWRRLKLQLR